MTDKPENPPAFPHPYYENKWDEPGMTLRDWFAGQIAAGMVAGCWKAAEEKQGAPLTMRQLAADYAANAYVLADAMLNERTKPNG